MPVEHNTAVTLWSDEGTRTKLRSLAKSTRLSQKEVLRILVTGATKRSVLNAILQPKRKS